MKSQQTSHFPLIHEKSIATKTSVGSQRMVLYF